MYQRMVMLESRIARMAARMEIMKLRCVSMVSMIRRTIETGLWVMIVIQIWMQDAQMMLINMTTSQIVAICRGLLAIIEGDAVFKYGL